MQKEGIPRHSNMSDLVLGGRDLMSGDCVPSAAGFHLPTSGCYLALGPAFGNHQSFLSVFFIMLWDIHMFLKHNGQYEVNWTSLKMWLISKIILKLPAW